MSSDTDSSTNSTSDSSVEHKKHKLIKKRNQKVEKKHKKHKKCKRLKEKKRSKKEEESKASFQQPIAFESNEECFGPALPPHLQQRSELTVATASSAPMIGPILPFNKDTELPKQFESDDEINIGPLPLNINTDKLSAEQVEREKRALELKIAALEGRGLQVNTSDDKTREEWMLELPEVGLKGGLAALSNLKRTFHAGKDKPDFSDRSAWTKTPQSESKDRNVINPKVNVEDLKLTAQDLYDRTRDAEQEKLAKKHKKKHKRDESLMELHQKKLRKAEKQKEKELAASGSKPERRPFSRDVDLKLNKIDKNQTKQIVDKAKILNSKFSSGKTKYL